MVYSGKQEVILLSNLMVQITLDVVRNPNMVIERMCVNNDIVWSLGSSIAPCGKLACSTYRMRISD